MLSRLNPEYESINAQILSQDPQTPLGTAFTLLQNEESHKVVVLILKSITVPDWSALDNLLMEEAVVMKVKNKATEVGKANIMTMDAHFKKKRKIMDAVVVEHHHKLLCTHVKVLASRKSVGI